jgi:hypothetical protein
MLCIRCEECETAADRPYCVHCMFAVRAEVEDGLVQLGQYLTRWAEFDAWCTRRRPLAA